MGETIAQKSDRLLREGRVHVVPSEAYAVQGDHGTYMVTRLPGPPPTWTCTCEAPYGCSHIDAAKKLRLRR